MYKFFIAFRYLTSRPISLVSIVGIFLSVGALIVVISVMSGFLRETKSYIRGTMSDIVITPFPYAHKLGNQVKYGRYPSYEILKTVIDSVDGIKGVAPRFVRPALIRKSQGVDLFAGSSKFSDMNFTKVLGISLEDERTVSNIDGFLDDVIDITARVDDPTNPFVLSDDHKDPRYFSRDFDSILVGEIKFLNLGLRKGDVITLATLDEKALEERKGEDQTVKPFEKKFFVAGAFRSGNHQFDIQNVIISLDAVDSWIDADNKISEIYVAVDDYKRDGNAICAAIDHAMGDKSINAQVETWEDVHAVFLGAVENERTILGVLLTFFILIAAFNVFATISMMVTDKTKDIGILVSMGATSFGIMKTFVICGLFMWLIGSLLGAVGGYFFADNINAIKDFLENLFGIEIFRSDVYNFREIPVELSYSFIGIVIAGTFVMCLFFSLLPSLRASWMDPVKALRHE